MKKCMKIIIIINLIIAILLFILAYFSNQKLKNNLKITEINESNFLEYNDNYYQLYSKNNKYILYDLNNKIINESSNKFTLYYDLFYSNNNKIYYFKKEKTNNTIFYENANLLYYPNKDLYYVNIDNQVLIYNKNNQEIKVSTDYKLIIMQDKLTYIYDNNNLYDINNFNKFSLSGIIISDNKTNYCDESSKNLYYNNPYLIVKNENKIAIIDNKLKIIKELKYDDLTIIDNNYYIVKKDNKYGIINKEEDIIMDIIYDKITYENNYYYLLKDSKLNVFNKDLKLIIDSLPFNDTNKMQCSFKMYYKVIEHNEYKYLQYLNSLYIIKDNDINYYEEGYLYDEFIIIKKSNELEIYNLDMNIYEDGIIKLEYLNDYSLNITKNIENSHYYEIKISYYMDNFKIEKKYLYDIKNNKRIDINNICYDCSYLTHDFYYSLIDNNLKIYINKNIIYELNDVLSIDVINKNLYAILTTNNSYKILKVE